MSKYKLFDGCLVLALDKRKEHWLELIEQGKSLGIEIIPLIVGSGEDKTLKYDLIDEVNPDVSQWGYGVPHLKHHHYNALKSHQKMLGIAKQKGWDRVLMLEDDSTFLSRTESLLTEIEERKDELDYCLSFPLFYLGWWSHGDETSGENRRIEDVWDHNGTMTIRRIYPDQAVGGLHGLIIRNDLFDTIINFPANNPIDTQLHHLRDKIPAILLEPKAIHTKSMWSETEGAYFERLKL